MNADTCILLKNPKDESFYIFDRGGLVSMENLEQSVILAVMTHVLASKTSVKCQPLKSFEF